MIDYPVVDVKDLRPGSYWWRASQEKPWLALTVFESHGQMAVGRYIADEEFPLSEFRRPGEWRGPIPEPQDGLGCEWEP